MPSILDGIDIDSALKEIETAPSPDEGGSVLDGINLEDHQEIISPTDEDRDEDGNFTQGVIRSAIERNITPNNLPRAIEEVSGLGRFSLSMPSSMMLDILATFPQHLMAAFQDEPIPSVNEKGEMDNARSPEGAEPRDILQDFPLTAAVAQAQSVALPEEGSVERMTGEALALMGDPANLLLGLGTTVHKLAGISGVLGAGQAATHQLAADQEINMEELMFETAASVAGPYAFEGIMMLGRQASKIGAQGRFDKAVDRVVGRAAGYVNKGYSNTRAIQKSLDDLNVQPKPFFQRLAETKGSSGEAIKAAQEAIASPALTTKAAKVFKDQAAKVSKPLGWFDTTVGRSIATRLEKIHPAIGRALRNMEMNKHILIGAKSTQARAWRSAYSALPEETQRQLDKHLMNGDFLKAEKIMQAFDGDPKVLAKTQAKGPLFKFDPSKTDKSFASIPEPPPALKFSEEFEQNIKPIFKEFGNMLQLSKKRGSSDTFELIDDFFPRVLSDRDGLLSKTKRGRHLAQKGISNTIDQKEKALGRPLTVTELDDLMTKELIKPEVKPLAPKSRHEQARQIDKLLDDEVPFYMNASDALEAYIHNVSEVISHRHLLGMTRKGSLYNDLDDTGLAVSKMLNDLVREKELLPGEADEAIRLIQARLGNGSKHMNASLNLAKNWFYATTLTNPIAAMTQLGDTALSGVLNGLGPSIKAIGSTIAQGNRIAKLDASDLFDLVRVSEELITTTALNKQLATMFRLSGFTTVDKFGKNVNILSTLNKAKGLVLKNADDPVSALQKEFGNSLFTNHEWASVAQDLADGTVSSNIRFMVWNRLSDAQPISLSEMPETYLRHPNGRIWYAMKSYALKQLDLIRKKGFDLLATPGRQQEGSEFLLKYAMLIGGANVGVDQLKSIIQGRDLDPRDLEMDRVAWAAFKGLGLSEYWFDKIQKAQDPGKEVLTVLIPGAFDHIGNQLEDAWKAGEAWYQNDLDEDPRDWRVLRNVPLVGTLFYNYLGGNEVWEEWKERQREEDED